MSELSRRIARRWKRQVEDEVRRDEARQAEPQPWRAVVWSIMWLGWLVVLILLIAQFRLLY